MGSFQAAAFIDGIKKGPQPQSTFVNVSAKA